MRRALAVGVVAASLAVPASAANVDQQVVLRPSDVTAGPATAALDPKDLVLHDVDVPRGFHLDQSNSGLLSNALLAAHQPELRPLIARTGRVTGYFVRYINNAPPRWTYVHSSATVFRRPEGAKMYLAWYIKEVRKEVSGRLELTAVDLGDKAWKYSTTSPETSTAVAWVHGRVVATAAARLVVQHRKLAPAVARIQQRRIVAALR